MIVKTTIPGRAAIPAIKLFKHEGSVIIEQQHPGERLPRTVVMSETEVADFIQRLRGAQ